MSTGGRVSWLGYKERESRLSLEDCLNWGAERLIKPKGKDSQRRVLQRRVVDRDRNLEICIRSPSDTQLTIDSCMNVQALSNIWKERVKMIRTNNALCSYRVSNSVCFYQPDWKVSRFMGHWVKYTKTLTLVVADN